MPKLQTTINALRGTIKFMKSHSMVTVACDDSFVQTLNDALEQLEEQNGLILALEQSKAVNEHLNALLKEQEARIQKYEYVFDFIGIGFREWTTKILNGEAEAICETDEHEYKTVVTFKLI